MLAVWPGYARQAAAQDWSPFVLVAGLLLIGLTADGDGLFAFAGRQLGRVARNGTVLFAGAVVIIAVVTATLNLDTSVAFLTPVLVYTAASQRPAGSAGAPDRPRWWPGRRCCTAACCCPTPAPCCCPGPT